METNKTCETCDFWDITQKQIDYLKGRGDLKHNSFKCIRYPPVAVIDQDDEIVTAFPIVYSDDSCGEWRLRKNEKI